MTENEVNQHHVLGLVGSPRNGGNTHILVDEILRGAEDAGATVEKIDITRKKIAPCLACDSCSRTGVCAQKDDMREVLDKMGQSDVWVFGTPVYWWGPTAQFKAFIDRWYGVQKELKEQRHKRIILAIPMGDTDERTARHTIGMFEDSLDWLENKAFATILAPGVDERGEAKERKEILTRAYQAGKDAVM